MPGDTIDATYTLTTDDWMRVDAVQGHYVAAMTLADKLRELEAQETELKLSLSRLKYRLDLRKAQILLYDPPVIAGKNASEREASLLDYVDKDSECKALQKRLDDETVKRGEVQLAFSDVQRRYQVHVQMLRAVAITT